VSRGGGWIVAAVLALTAHGCDRFDPPAAGAPPAAEQAPKAQAGARDAMTAVMKAAQAATSTCVAGELVWEADENVGSLYGGEGFSFEPPPPTHFSRPCIPERCAPTTAELDALRTSVRSAKTVIDGSVDLRVPTYQGFIALADAMVSFADAAVAGVGQGKDLRFSGFSMHYTTLATAYREVIPEADVPAEPPSLVASLAVPEPGGDPCKGWRVPRFCDVRGVRVPKVIKWRADPPCIEVESIRK
jgi:hypothetical protein